MIPQVSQPLGLHFRIFQSCLAAYHHLIAIFKLIVFDDALSRAEYFPVSIGRRESDQNFLAIAAVSNRIHALILTRALTRLSAQDANLHALQAAIGFPFDR